MVVSKIVDVDRETKKYFIPTHRHTSLRTGAPGTGTLAGLAWHIPISGAVMEDLMECFRLEGPAGNDPVVFIVSKGGFRVDHTSVDRFLQLFTSFGLFNVPIGGMQLS